VPWKGVRESIRAVALARARGVAVELEVIGTGPQHSDLEAQIRAQGLGGIVTLCGSQSAEEIRARLRGSDVFLQHSLTSESGWQEGFGVSLAEAAAMELPVIATRTGGIPDQVLHEVTGLLVPETDVEGMADALVRLGRDPALRAQLGKAGRERMVRHFDVSQQITKLEAVLVDAARSRHPPRRGLFASATSTTPAPARLLPLDLQRA
jgi:glycosyltransferase involved in cell wall biosynthesis